MKLTREQAAIISAYTGFMAGPFSDMHEYVEKILGRPVWTHELASREVNEEIRAASKADFVALCADRPENGQSTDSAE